MRAMRVVEHGRPLELAEVAVPEPGPGEVLLRVHACGLNFADTLMVDGRYQEKPELPFSPGLEVCGTVVALGAGVSDPPPGTRVACFAGRGGLAEYLAVPAALCVARACRRWRTRRPRASLSPTAPAMSRSPGWRGCAPARRCWCSAPPAGSG